MTVRKMLNAIALLFLLTSMGRAADDKILFMPLAPNALASDVGASAFATVGTFHPTGAFFWISS